MKWIIGTGSDIAVDNNQLQARRDYIQSITDANVSMWNYIRINGQICKEYLYCTSNDSVNGTFLTAHIDDVYKLCSLRGVFDSKFVVANTCIWERMSHKKLLYSMKKYNENIELWFAKQELTVNDFHILRQSTTIKNVGMFGFQTSLSERELFKNRSKGLMSAIRESFVRVSPIILPGD